MIISKNCLTLRKRVRVALSLFLSLGLLATTTESFGNEAVTVIHAGTVLVGDRLESVRNHSIVVTGDTITRIEKDFITIDGAHLVDLSDKHILPGLIEAHVHLQHGGPGPSLRQDLTHLEDGVMVLRGYAEARRSLEAGFTTLRDLAGDPDVVFDLRDAINMGLVQGPRILAAGPALMPTGGGIIRGLRRDVMGTLEHSNLEYPCDGADECRKAVRALVKAGADFIKVVVTASISAPGEGGAAYQMTPAELESVVEAAHLLDRKVAAHAHGLEGINMAIKAGVDSIEHGTFGDRTSMDLYKETGTFLVPTPLDEAVRRARSRQDIPEEQKQKLIAANEHWMRMLRLASAAGINVAFGTDTQVGAHGRSAEKFKVYEAAGMKPDAIIESATIKAAMLLGIDRETGSLETGKLADLIAVSENPLDNIDALQNVEFVMKSGAIIKSEAVEASRVPPR